MIFEFGGVLCWYEYARSRMELKRQKSVIQLVARKEELGKDTLTTSTLETTFKKAKKNPLNDNGGIRARSCMRDEQTLKVTAETDNGID